MKMKKLQVCVVFMVVTAAASIVQAAQRQAGDFCDKLELAVPLCRGDQGGFDCNCTDQLRSVTAALPNLNHRQQQVACDCIDASIAKYLSIIKLDCGSNPFDKVAVECDQVRRNEAFPNPDQQQRDEFCYKLDSAGSLCRAVDAELGGVNCTCTHQLVSLQDVLPNLNQEEFQVACGCIGLLNSDFWPTINSVCGVNLFDNKAVGCP